MLSLNSLAERRGLPISFSDLEELLNGCSQLEVGQDRFGPSHWCNMLSIN